jgi:hypothetical protein
VDSRPCSRTSIEAAAITGPEPRAAAVCGRLDYLPLGGVEEQIDQLLAVGVGENPRESLSELARLGARMIIQRAVEHEFDAWLGPLADVGSLKSWQTMREAYAVRRTVSRRLPRSGARSWSPSWRCAGSEQTNDEEEVPAL